MKNFKKISAAIAATLMAATLTAPMAITSSAADITISQPVGTATNVTHTYEAYQIFKGTLADGVLSNIEWGNGVVASKTVGEVTTNLIDEIKAIKIGETIPFSACAEAKDVADVLSGTEENPTQDDADIAKAFASVVGKYLAATPAGTSDADGKIADLADGYYLVQDKSDSPVGGEGYTPNTDAKTRYILKVAGEDVKVTAKSSAPTVVKKVKENTDVSDYEYYYGKTEEAEGTKLTDKDYNDIADYNIGDTVPFRLYGTLPDTYADYEHYFYQFNDTLGSEFDLDASSVKITVNGADIDANANTDITISVNGNKIDITIDDVKAIAPNKTDVITVSYNATLNDKAKIGRPGQVNAVKLTYSSNPNEKYEPKKDREDKPNDTGTTIEDKVIVFTYEIDATKIVAGTTTPLKDAKFYLYKENTDGTRSYYSGVKTAWYDISGDTPVKMTEKPTAEQIENKTVKKVTESVWTTVASTTVEGSNEAVWTVPDTVEKLVSGEDGKFIVKGIDEGTFLLEETDAPAGYNKLTSAVKLVVDANTKDVAVEEIGTDRQDWQYGKETNQGELALVDLTLKVDEKQVVSSDDENKGIVKTNIENSKGSTLPSTGGIGTTLFYVGGGAMVAVAGVFLITKKRMGRRED